MRLTDDQIREARIRLYGANEIKRNILKALQKRHHKEQGCMDNKPITELKEIEPHLLKLRTFQRALPAEWRIALWAVIQSGYCDQCGKELQPEEVCHCENE